MTLLKLDDPSEILAIIKFYAKLILEEEEDNEGRGVTIYTNRIGELGLALENLFIEGQKE